MCSAVELTLERAHERGMDNDARVVEIETDAGVIHCRFHEARPGNRTAALWVFGAGGGLDGPAGGMYIRLAQALSKEGIASLRLDYRRPGDLMACQLDVLCGLYYLGSKKRTRVILVGHSFGGAVVIGAALRSPSVAAVAVLSSQFAGVDAVERLSPKPLLLIHGRRDEILPHSCTESLFQRAGEPKRMLLYDCGHGLDECRTEVESDLLEWIRDIVTVKPFETGAPPAPSSQ